MIKKIFIDNFKSLNDFTIELKPLTVIVGNNAMGKSSILQAVSFLANCTVDDFRIILERRNWSVNNIKSRVGNSNNSRITFETTVQLGDDELRWKMVLQTNVKKNTIHLISESIIDILKDEVLLEYRNTAGGFINDDGELIDIPANFIVSSSCMKIIKGIKNVGYRLKKIADFFENSASFELLSPKDMRLSSRGEVKTIGESGRNLPSFIKQMNNIQKEHFMTKVKKILGERIDDTSISHFGIGILTCFMIANDIDIVRSSDEQNEANSINLRKVNGSYLLRKMDKNELDERIKQHGTMVKLYVRNDVDMKN